MKKAFVLGSLLVGAFAAKAQIPEDALKFSGNPVKGTARIMAIGGAMGSLGGDISTTFTNPAGLGFYKTSDFVLSPGFSFLNNKSQYRGGSEKDKDKYFNLGTSGIVGGWQGSGRWTSHAIGFAVTRTADFTNAIYYKGQNNFSSFGEQYAAEAANSGLSIDDILNSNSVSLGTRMAIYNFFADTATLGNNANPDFVSMAMYNNLKNGGDFLVNQSHSIETSGGITEIALGYAANMDDKVYIGGSIGVPIVRYDKTSILREDDATGINNNYFDFAELTERYTTKGAGINARLGMIVKPSEFVRLGFAVHTPTLYALSDTYHGFMSVNTENARSTPGTVSVSSDVFTNNTTPKYKYELITPWKFMISGSYVLREIEDVRKQKGFITADAEYVTYRSNRYRNAEDFDDGGYYAGVNEGVKSYYKGALNFRVGGELKFTTLMTRLGFAYYGNPYKDKELKGNRMYISGGLGYRHAGMFIDLTYVHALTKDVNFPYRLPDKANTFATTRGNGSNIMLTLGFKI